MSFDYRINNNLYYTNPSFRSDSTSFGVLRKPIETVQKTIESGVDGFVSKENDTKERKKVRKRAIAVSSTVLVLGALTMILNPRGSSKMASRIKSWQAQLDVKIKHSKDDFLKSKFYTICKKISNFAEKGGHIYFNFNSGKDILFQSLCTNANKKYPEFLTKNKTVHSIVKALDDGFVKIFDKPHKKITQWFDSISIYTVKNKYQKASNKMDELERLIDTYKDKLSYKERDLVNKKLKEIKTARTAFSEAKTMERLKEQENLMAGLEEDLYRKIYNDKDGFAKNSTSFWVLESLKSQKAAVEKAGLDRTTVLIGEKGHKGLYDEVLDIFRKQLAPEEMKAFDNIYNGAAKKIRKANYSECTEYFDKKRDLKVGSAPTDIVTQIFGLGLCGLAVGTAEKEDRVSKLLTTGLPVVTGLGSSLIFSALLWAGGTSLLAGLAVSGVTSGVCYLINKHILGNEKNELPEESIDNNPFLKEANNA